MPGTKKRHGAAARAQGIKKRKVTNSNSRSKSSEGTIQKTQKTLTPSEGTIQKTPKPSEGTHSEEIIYSRREEESVGMRNLQRSVGHINFDSSTGNGEGLELGSDPDVPQQGNERGVIREIEPPAVMSTFDSVGGHVPQKLKDKIWEGGFIDLSLLLKSSRELANAMEDQGGLVYKDGKLVIEKQVQGKPLYNIHSWTSAFLIYISVMIERHPGKAQELVKYLRDIRLLASRAPSTSAWVKYDEQFRLKKVRNPASSWGLIDSELWLICMSPFNFHQKQISSGGQSNFRGSSDRDQYFAPQSNPPNHARTNKIRSNNISLDRIVCIVGGTIRELAGISHANLSTPVVNAEVSI